MNTSPHRYDDSDREAIYRVIRERRDMRHFHPAPIDPATLQRLLEAAHAAPSVGLSQPWRFLRIRDRPLRQRIHALVQLERDRTADALDDRREEFLHLKVEGILDCAELLVALVRDGGCSEVFGRRTLPQMDLASTACAIQNLWLASRAEGLGLGWVSMFDPASLTSLLQLPPGLSPVAILCLGQVDHFYSEPMLVMERWRQPRPLSELMFDDRWPEGLPA